MPSEIPAGSKAPLSLIEENCHPGSGPVPEPADPRLDLLNGRIDRFGDGGGRLQLDCAQNPPQTRFDRPGSSRLDHGDIPTGVEVPLRTLAMIVSGTLLVPVRALEPPKWLMGQFQCDLPLFHLEVDLQNASGSGQVRQLFNEDLSLARREDLIHLPILHPTHTKFRSPKVRSLNKLRTIWPWFEDYFVRLCYFLFFSCTQTKPQQA